MVGYRGFTGVGIAGIASDYCGVGVIVGRTIVWARARQYVTRYEVLNVLFESLNVLFNYLHCFTVLFNGRIVYCVAPTPSEAVEVKVNLELAEAVAKLIIAPHTVVVRRVRILDLVFVGEF